MIGGKQQLSAIIGEAIVGIDERYDGYRNDLAKAIIEVIGTQESAATETSRRDQIQQVADSIGTSIASAGGTAE